MNNAKVAKFFLKLTDIDGFYELEKRVKRSEKIFILLSIINGLNLIIQPSEITLWLFLIGLVVFFSTMLFAYAKLLMFVLSDKYPYKDIIVGHKKDY